MVAEAHPDTGDDDRRWQAIHAERRRFRELVADLTPEQWQQPSVCAGWRVQEVVAHVAAAPTLRMREVPGMLWRGRGDFDRMILLDGIARGRARPEQIVALLAAHASSRHKLPGSYPLIDTVVHTFDVTRALGVPWQTPPEVAAAAADQARPLARLMGAGKLLRAVRLRANDSDWSCGRGAAEVTGPTQELLLVLCGRARIAESLSGAGVDLLRRD
ncbi:maleylpyruvate isomerase family mycothiol-dependent enzyme [Nocardioides daejeonensis]|uniref:maleylpyruvate isomerase family mycothiol-dependent enzyme n=1 Tax=Nocardioides daejeonensis TaxID=1046556 RepID=UPI0013A5B360|nr:maleylpyruvate isomerase family mycothiol-dependent enzyme [Nocardioides daejeonensis]